MFITFVVSKDMSLLTDCFTNNFGNMDDVNKFVEEVFALAESDEIRQRAEEIIETAKRNDSRVELRESNVFNAISASYIAKRFFGKSRFWISQKINHNIKNGKRDDFTPEQRETLKKAFETIADELMTLAEDM